MEKFKLELGGKDLLVEIKNLAEKANGSCWIRYGDTVVLATAVMGEEREEKDFFPLTVEYQERFYAAGKILGSRFIRRESRPSDEAILTSRLIDRAIRPRFPENLKREVQVIITCLSWDRENDPDIPGLIAASISLGISDIPWQGPIAALRVGEINPGVPPKAGYGADKKFILNPIYEQREKSNLDLVLTAVSQDLEKKNGVLVNMIEAEGQEVQEEIVLKAVEFSEPYLKKLIEFQNQIIKKAGKKKIDLPELSSDLELESEIKEFLGDRLEKALYEKSGITLDNLKEELAYFVEGKPSTRAELGAGLVPHRNEVSGAGYPGPPTGGGKIKYALDFFEKEIERLVHENIIKFEKRPDGRKLDEIREISCEVGVLPRTHGSGLFQRGETKSLSILTLGAPEDVKLLEGMEFIGKKRFMHHYNFPPYCSGEIKPLRGPGRREIGHGMLAEKALMGLCPNFEEFPYTLRIVSEILSSNGSTSMASVSSSILALMDAGVPIKNSCAGIALGLMQNDKGSYKILTDIQGPEDHHGDMDFKIAGTKNGITAIQMDVKVRGIDEKILKETLERGKKARLQILSKMEKTIQKPRTELSPWAPRVYVLQIRPEKIREVIGPGGKIIHEIIEECGVSINVENSGQVFVTAEKEEGAKKAVAWIKNITREIKVGEIFQGKVKRIVDFGAFLEILPGQDGLVHISQMAPYRVNKVEDIIKVGDVVPVKVISIDEQGRINLSMKEVER